MSDDFKLTPQEQRLLACAARGEEWSPKYFGDEIQLDFDPAYAYGWREDRTIRASVIRCLAAGESLPGEDKARPVGTKGLRVVNASIIGSLDLEGATLNRTFWLHGCASDGAVILRDAEAKTVSFHGSHLRYGLNATRASIKGNIHLGKGFSAEREVVLMGATIGGQIICIGGNFDNLGGRALTGNSATVGGSIYLSDGFVARGEVDLTAANIKGGLICNRGSFENQGERALIGGSMVVGLDVFLGNGFSAKGEVNLTGAQIGGQLDCTRGRFDNSGGTALRGNAMTVGADVLLHDGFSASGEVDFVRATIKGTLTCARATFSNPFGKALDFTLAEIGASLFFRQLIPDKGAKRGLEGMLVLEQAKCRTYSDDRQSWPEAGNLVLDGFVYERFHDCDTDCATRRDWLRLQRPEHLSDSFRPQPWVQAVKVLHEMGHDDDARDLAVEREMARREAEKNPWRKTWLGMLHFTVGSGYKPWWALYWSLGFFLFGWLTFYGAHALGYMAPRDGSVIAYLAANPGRPLPPRYTEFNSLLYAADAFLPVIELGQDQVWEPTTVRDPRSPPLPTDSSPHSKDVRGAAEAFAAGAHRVVYWAEEVLGWIFVSLFIAGMSGIMKKE